ncbi:MAG: D-aminoacyl-tRNA deacylase [Candidatus Pacearchaeota archaeon]|nr:D-aminoacyl-tRNA deacylase [Candidatus Pacearchaeota archaeon]
MRKYLIVAEKQDKAGVNITTQLSQFGNYDFYLVDGNILENENLDSERINKYDYVIFASKHKSVKKEKTLCVHSPGNFGEAKLGGISNKICKTSALFNKFLFERLHEVTNEHEFDKYNLTMEATHHGPLISVPCTFVEIGSTESEWKDNRAGFIIAKTIHKTISEFKENPYHEIAFAIGGPHYCPNFNKIQLKSNVAISHVVPQYALPITDDMIKEIVEKTKEEIDFAIIDWKGLGKSEERKKVLEVLDKNYISYKRTSEIKR